MAERRAGVGTASCALACTTQRRGSRGTRRGGRAGRAGADPSLDQFLEAAFDRPTAHAQMVTGVTSMNEVARSCSRGNPGRPRRRSTKSEAGRSSPASTPVRRKPEVSEILTRDRRRTDGSKLVGTRTRSDGHLEVILTLNQRRVSVLINRAGRLRYPHELSEAGAPCGRDAEVCEYAGRPGRRGKARG